MASPAPPGKDKKKHRLSFGRILGGKKDEDSQHSHNSSEVQPSNSSGVADSAYASSENEPRGSNSKGPDVVSYENTGQISGVSSDRNLTMNQKTGDVMDEATGEVVSTVTYVYPDSQRRLRHALIAINRQNNYHYNNNDYYEDRQGWEEGDRSNHSARCAGCSRDAGRQPTLSTPTSNNQHCEQHLEAGSCIRTAAASTRTNASCSIKEPSSKIERNGKSVSRVTGACCRESRIASRYILA